MTVTERTRRHQRNGGLEDLLQLLNADLSVIGDQTLPADRTPPQPTVFLVGCARSGTTLALQWLSQLGHFSWPSNLISRFYAAPWVGARVQQMLTDPAYDFRGELTLEAAMAPQPYASQLGKTRGLLAPNEFWYWWRRFLPDGPTHCLSDEQLSGVDRARLRAELATWQDVTGKPLAMKALIMNWNLPWLAETVPGSVFVHVTRDRFFHAQSLWEARREFHGDQRIWYSFLPLEYPQLQELRVADQIAGQIHHTETAIARGLAQIASERQLQVAYEDLCASPDRVYQDVRKMLAAQDHSVSAIYSGPKSFPVSRTMRLNEADQDALHTAWRAYPDAI